MSHNVQFLDHSFIYVNDLPIVDSKGGVTLFVDNANVSNIRCETELVKGDIDKLQE